MSPYCPNISDIIKEGRYIPQLLSSLAVIVDQISTEPLFIALSGGSGKKSTEKAGGSLKLHSSHGCHRIPKNLLQIWQEAVIATLSRFQDVYSWHFLLPAHIRSFYATLEPSFFIPLLLPR